jgi:myo-inositol-1(or 4)-monophosphatase
MVRDKSFLKVAIKAAKEAGQIHVDYFKKFGEVQTKSTSIDRVTIADKKAEEKIFSQINKNFPRHSFLGEESLLTENKSDYLWVVDPLDGTTNYSHGLPVCAVSIALAYKNNVILGVVFDAFRNELFVAEKDKGAKLNGESISVSKNIEWDCVLASTGFGYTRDIVMRKNLKMIDEFMSKPLLGLRRTGSAAIDLCYVACGRFDLFWEHLLNPWDMAAGSLIISEAGGQISDFSGKLLSLKKSSVLASNGLLHKKAQKILCRV